MKTQGNETAFTLQLTWNSAAKKLKRRWPWPWKHRQGIPNRPDKGEHINTESHTAHLQHWQLVQFENHTAFRFVDLCTVVNSTDNCVQYDYVSGEEGSVPADSPGWNPPGLLLLPASQYCCTSMYFPYPPVWTYTSLYYFPLYSTRLFLVISPSVATGSTPVLQLSTGFALFKEVKKSWAFCFVIHERQRLELWMNISRGCGGWKWLRPRDLPQMINGKYPKSWAMS